MINTKFHIIYKTSHVNGKYYFGRHSTSNLNDGYIGSGKWVRSIKDKTQLKTEIIAVAETFEDLKLLEEFYISENLGKTNCMNINDSSIGFSSEQATIHNNKRVEKGIHPFIGGKIQKIKVENGTHHLLSGKIQSKYQKTQYENGTHPWCSTEKRKEIQRKINESGTRNIDIQQRRQESLKRAKEGTHPFQDKEKSKARAQKRMADGTHNCLTIHICDVCGKVGKGPQMIRHHFKNCKSNK